eukprot:10641-Heterococcus_DN1.PRE.2
MQALMQLLMIRPHSSSARRRNLDLQGERDVMPWMCYACNAMHVMLWHAVPCARAALSQALGMHCAYRA